MNTLEKLNKLRALMQAEKIDAYYIPTSDFHDSEYVGGYFKGRSWLSGFTGSAGMMVVTMDEVCLWTDGRYFIQAEEQLAGSSIQLMKMLEPGVPTVSEYLSEKLKAGNVLAFDGRCVSYSTYLDWQKILPEVVIKTDLDVFASIWEERPALPNAKAFLLSDSLSGKKCEDKLADVRKIMKQNQADWHLLTTLDDLAWLFNMRGDDVSYSPVVLSYALISMDEVLLFVDEDKFDEQAKLTLKANHIQLLPYFDVYHKIKEIKGKIMLNGKRVNSRLALMSQEIIDQENPTTLMKAIKNETELKHTRHAHIKDGVAVSKFMIWLKQAVLNENITEISAADKLESLRREQADFLELSFTTIAGYKEHAALMHYSATKESDVVLKPEGMLLVDSGGTYLDGTTDITRTFILGPVSETIKEHYTAVLSGMLRLSMAKFLYGCTGINLDILARGPVWDLGIDYRCGTGHGVGHILNVHEGPHDIRWRARPNTSLAVFEPGMIVTNEPGVYIEGSHGIRIENELITAVSETNEYGTFLNFETITMAPIDLDAVLPEKLSNDERNFLNAYHQCVYEKISPFLSESEQQALKHYTRSI